MMNYESKSNEIKMQFLKHMESLDNAEVSAQEVYEGLVDEIILGIIFDVHHAAKSGVLDFDDEMTKEDDSFGIDGLDFDDEVSKEGESFSIDELDIGVEVLGHKSTKSEYCTCPVCNRSVGAVKFTTHLVKCCKKGRNSSRASSRNANSKESIYCETKSDDENDSDMTITSSRKRKVNGVKKPKKQKSRSGGAGGGNFVDNGVSSANTPPFEYDGMTYDDKRILFAKFCGVISENTGKLCNRSMRCPQHSDEQRRNIRALVLQSENGLGGAEEDGEGHSNTSSPTDSSSSNSSKKRQKAHQSKAYKNSPNFTNSNHLLLE